MIDARSDLVDAARVRLEVRTPWAYRLPRFGEPHGLTRVRGATVERLLHVDDLPVHLRVTQSAADRVVFVARAASREVAARGIERMRKALGVDQDLRPFHERFRSDRLIGAAVRRDPGLRVVGRPAPFEALAWAICEQLIESERAAAIERRLIARFGRRSPGAGLRDSPTAGVLAGQSQARLQSLDLSASQSAALLAAAREVASGRVDLDDPDHERGWRRLRAIRGIGSWTIQSELSNIRCTVENQVVIKALPARVADGFSGAALAEFGPQYLNVVLDRWSQIARALRRTTVVIVVLGVGFVLFEGAKQPTFDVGPLEISSRAAILPVIPVVVSFLVYEWVLLAIAFATYRGVVVSLIRTMHPSVASNNLEVLLYPPVASLWGHEQWRSIRDRPPGAETRRLDLIDRSVQPILLGATFVFLAYTFVYLYGHGDPSAVTAALVAVVINLVRSCLLLSDRPNILWNGGHRPEPPIRRGHLRWPRR
jgi:hypothetical protein